MELLLVMGFIFVLLLGVLIVAYTQSASFSSDVTAAQLQKVGNQMADAANTVYYAGPPTKKTITLYFPQHINNVTINSQSIIFNAQGPGGNYEYAVRTATNLTGTIQSFPGVHTVVVEAQLSAVNITG